ncbi:hypothetical protein FHT17_002426 [Novosphingobium sp. SG916]|nr:hypothetical protein [Novosphingobium sp. SG919]NMN87527.1 hypothetical protein [Novosphingobium sp. SG916]
MGRDSVRSLAREPKCPSSVVGAAALCRTYCLACVSLQLYCYVMQRGTRKTARAIDPSSSIFDYLEDEAGLWVECPNCKGPANVAPRSMDGRYLANMANLTCFSCLMRRENKDTTDEDTQRCGSCGTRVSIENPVAKPRLSGKEPPNRRSGCGFCRRLQQGCDPFFGLPLFLKTKVGDKELWAVNRRHAVDLQYYLGAMLRERGKGFALTAFARLPAWVKTASSRPKVLHALGKMLSLADRHRLP